MSYIIKIVDRDEVDARYDKSVYLRFDKFPGNDVIDDLECYIFNHIDRYEEVHNNNLYSFIGECIDGLDCELIVPNQEIEL